jgi:hypothetical protein
MTLLLYIIASLLVSLTTRRVINLSAKYKARYYDIVGDFYYWRLVVDEDGVFTCDEKSKEYSADSDDGLAPTVKYGYFIPVVNVLFLIIACISYAVWLVLYLYELLPFGGHSKVPCRFFLKWK